MQIFTNEVTVPEACLPLAAAAPEDTLMVDIETTGLNPVTSHLYLIGCVFRANGQWLIRQYLAEDPSEEVMILLAFSELAGHFTTLMHFNGERFDLPYLRHRFSHHHLPCPFEGCRSVDLYQDLRRLRRLLNLEHMNQKSLEGFLHVGRDDQMSGGELIAVYERYSLTRSPEDLYLLRIHNQEDLSGMPQLLRLYSYRAFLASPAPYLENAAVESARVQTEDADEPSESLLSEDAGKHLQAGSRLIKEAGEPLSENVYESLQLSVQLPQLPEFPVPVRAEVPGAGLTLSGQTARLDLALCHGEAKHFFSNYRDYYYLPVEDAVYHKSAARFVDPRFREPARPDNCCVKKTGVFLPQPEGLYTPVFSRYYHDPLEWFEYDEAAGLSEDEARRLFTAWMASFMIEPA